MYILYKLCGTYYDIHWSSINYKNNFIILFFLNFKQLKRTVINQQHSIIL